MDRPTIFVGSSSEGLDVARAVKQQFDNEADVDLWNEGVFKLNTSTLESLLRTVNVYDFAILVLTPDDVVTSRGKRRTTPRDNVTFEHGLFLGRLGPRRAFVVCDDSIKPLSDFAGITVATYRKRDPLMSAVSSACDRIRACIREQQERSEISLLPSTALAIGYYQNFVVKVVAALQERKDIKLKIKRDAEDQQAIPIGFARFLLRVIIPDSLSDVAHGSLLNKVGQHLHITLSTPFRDFPFYIHLKDRSSILENLPAPGAAKDDLHTELLEVFDIPTTLLASREAIDLILKDSFLGTDKDREKLATREIQNFKKTLGFLIQRDYGKESGSYIQLDAMRYLNAQ